MSRKLKRSNKINILIAIAGLNIGGAEVMIKHLVRSLNKFRFNITVCCIKVCGIIGNELLKDGYEVVCLSESDDYKVDYLTFLKLLRIIRAKKIDIIHTHSKDALADAAVCKLLLPRLKLIHTFHFGNYLNLGWRNKKRGYCNGQSNY